MAAGRGHLYQDALRAFPSRMTTTFILRAAMSNETRANIVSRAENWRWGSLWGWLQKPEPQPCLLSPWPIPRRRNWVARVNEPLTENELKVVRICATRGTSLGDDGWGESLARRLNLSQPSVQEVDQECSHCQKTTPKRFDRLASSKRSDPFASFQRGLTRLLP